MQYFTVTNNNLSSPSTLDTNVVRRRRLAPFQVQPIPSLGIVVAKHWDTRKSMKSAETVRSVK